MFLKGCFYELIMSELHSRKQVKNSHLFIIEQKPDTLPKYYYYQYDIRDWVPVMRLDALPYV